MTEAAHARVRVVEDADELARAAAVDIRRTAVRAFEERGLFRLVLAGGSTPLGVYRLLASDAWRGRIQWLSTELFFGDERAVPAWHEDSNYRAAREALLDPLGIPEHRVHPMIVERTGSGDGLEEAARAYERDIAVSFALPAPGERWDEGPAGTRRAGSLPRFDLVLLGLGEDGHTASLFPGTPALDEQERWVVPVRLGEERRDRLTLTAPVLSAARAVLVLVSGARKAPALRALLADDGDPHVTPARLVRPTSGRLSILADEAAARDVS